MAIRGRVNIKVMAATISRAVATNPQVAGLARKQGILAVENSKQLFLDEVRNHPVSMEIDDGPSDDNITNTLAGVDGNLFSFIGFHISDSPIDNLIEVLSSKIFLKGGRAGTKRFRNGNVNFRFRVTIPGVKDLDKEGSLAFPDGWRPGSWVDGIERGISGLPSFIFKQQGFKDSRSLVGLQAKTGYKKGAAPFILRSEEYQPTDYMRVLLTKFSKTVIKGSL